MRAMGIDIGTTTISVIMIDGESGELLGSRSISHQAFLNRYSHAQDPQKLWMLTEAATLEMMREYGRPDSIGMTGQMHGVLYVNKEGEAVSPLYTWQDSSGNEQMPEGITYAGYLARAGGASATGYGLITHFCLQEKGQLPDDAAGMCTISDYIAMKLCGLSEPWIARDMAASWGCFDLKKGDFYRKELEALGVKLNLLPRILPAHPIVGETTGNLFCGIPVAASLGDNQASLLGSVRSLSDTVLVNIGTGSQVSFCTGEYYPAGGSVELRPCTEKLYLMAGSSLCGGRAYAMLEQFYREASGIADSGAMYEVMERQARDFIRCFGRDSAWKIRTTFSGTRSNPHERGSIQGVGVENFHPGAMTVGIITGILTELQEMYRQMRDLTGTYASKLVGSGNGIRRNPLMRELAQELFSMKMDIPVCQEEAAYGAALQSLAAARKAGDLEELQKKIRYL